MRNLIHQLTIAALLVSASNNSRAEDCISFRTFQAMVPTERLGVDLGDPRTAVEAALREYGVAFERSRLDASDPASIVADTMLVLERGPSYREEQAFLEFRGGTLSGVIVVMTPRLAEDNYEPTARELLHPSADAQAIQDDYARLMRWRFGAASRPSELELEISAAMGSQLGLEMGLEPSAIRLADSVGAGDDLYRLDLLLYALADGAHDQRIVVFRQGMRSAR